MAVAIIAEATEAICSDIFTVDLSFFESLAEEEGDPGRKE